MKQTFILAAISAAVIQAAPRRVGGRRQSEKLKNDKKFLEYASKYNKEIGDSDDFALRQELYHATDAKINKQNAKSMPGSKNALRFAHNQFSDMTKEEFHKRMGLNPATRHTHSASLPMHRLDGTLKNIPDAVNWATTGNP